MCTCSKNFPFKEELRTSTGGGSGRTSLQGFRMNFLCAELKRLLVIFLPNLQISSRLLRSARKDLLAACPRIRCVRAWGIWGSTSILDRSWSNGAHQSKHLPLVVSISCWLESRYRSQDRTVLNQSDTCSEVKYLSWKGAIYEAYLARGFAVRYWHYFEQEYTRRDCSICNSIEKKKKPWQNSNKSRKYALVRPSIWWGLP